MAELSALVLNWDSEIEYPRIGGVSAEMMFIDVLASYPLDICTNFGGGNELDGNLDSGVWTRGVGDVHPLDPKRDG